jgi:hypothetical protein
VKTTVRNLTRLDTVLVNVTAEARLAVAGFTVQVAPDSLFIYSRFTLNPSVSTIAGVAVDAQGQVIPHVAVKFAQSDTLVLGITPDFSGSTATLKALNNGQSGSRPGRAVVSAVATVYGVTVRDSTPVTLVAPSLMTILAQFTTPHSTGMPVGHFEPIVATAKLENGAVFLLISGGVPYPIDMVFDAPPGAVVSAPTESAICRDPSHEITSFTLDPHNTADPCPFRRTSRFLLLTVPGTYRYHSAMYGTTGSIVILP